MTILTVGLACVDVVHVVSHFPTEDSCQRSLDKYESRGGNASNMCSLFSLFNMPSEFLGTLAKDTWESSFILRDLDSINVTHVHCPLVEGKQSPFSSILVNSKNGSRTIVHSNLDLPELGVEDFARIPTFDLYKWVHFEGRNVDNVLKMIEHTRRLSPALRISAEVEKVGVKAEQLIEQVDLAFVSKEVASSHGAQNKMEAVKLFTKNVKRPHGQLVVAWGDQGAAGFDAKSNKIYQSQAFVPKEGVVNTIGAGDTFNAALIAFMVVNDDTGMKMDHLEKALKVACKVAGARVGHRSLDPCLADVFYEACKNRDNDQN